MPIIFRLHTGQTGGRPSGFLPRFINIDKHPET
jgi:hypothetical protein